MKRLGVGNQTSGDPMGNVARRRSQPISIKRQKVLAHICVDSHSAGAVNCYENCMGDARVARLTGQRQKNKERGPRLGEERGRERGKGS
eukprot:3018458-Pyramimonas_sp.AAC.2